MYMKRKAIESFAKVMGPSDIGLEIVESLQSKKLLCGFLQ